MRISDWSSDVCSSDLAPGRIGRSSILRAFDTRNDAPQEFPTDATFPPFAALGADCVRRGSPAGRPCPRHALFRRLRQAPDVQTLRHVEMQEPMYVYARDGRLMALRSEERPVGK